GHEAGAQITEKIVREAHTLGIREMSFWGSSMDNLIKRPLREKQALLEIYAKYFEKLINEKEVHVDRTKIRFIGRWEEQFPESLKKILYRCIEETQGYDQYFLNFFLAYGGTDDMLGAFQKVAALGIDPQSVTREVLKQHLMTAEITPVDMLIRTGGDPHNSDGFLMWDTAYSQLSFPNVYYPDFTPEEFQKSLHEYAERERRFGK
ncbi:MAG: polyprenyl diphosphate synthase, partial [Candidatus Zixiibacteriota bacterium]